MARRMPKLEVIEAFIEAARAPSFQVAASRCSLSPAAFSRRVQAFVQFAGCEVFEKSPRGMRLTDAGRRYLEDLEPAYLELRRAALDLGASEDERRVTLSLSHSFAVGFLIPRLERFSSRHPGVEVVMRTERTTAAVRSGDVDLGVFAADIDISGLVIEHLMDQFISPVAAPQIAVAFRSGRIGFADVQALNMSDPEIWSWYCAQIGMDVSVLRLGPCFDVLNAMYEAAASGLGIAPAAHPTVAPHLFSGRLVHLGLPTARWARGYCLAATEARSRKPAVRLLWRWLTQEAKNHTPDWTAMQPHLPSAASTRSAIL